MTLLQALEREPVLTERTLVPIITEMLQALDCIHRLRLVHRDVKPDNFLCSGKKRTVKLCDFGLSGVLPGHRGKLQGVVGTAPYMSPEMLKPSRHMHDTKTDIWSVGVIAYILLCGQFPYQPSQASPDMKTAILVGTPKPSFQPVVGLDGQLSPLALEFLQALLNRRADKRPTAADALQLPWAASPEDGRRSEHSLHPVLCMAKHSGAFDLKEPLYWQGSLDKTLTLLQAKHHGVPKHSGDSPGRRGRRACAHFDREQEACGIIPGMLSGELGHQGRRDAETTEFNTEGDAMDCAAKFDLHLLEDGNLGSGISL